MLKEGCFAQAHNDSQFIIDVLLEEVDFPLNSAIFPLASIGEPSSVCRWPQQRYSRTPQGHVGIGRTVYTRVH